MSESTKKQSFLHGTMLLAMATAIVKVIGALYKIPLNAIIGSQGFSYYSTAYDIYNVLLMISTAGLPVAMSRMIAQASSLDRNNQIRRIYTTARGIFLGLGLIGTLLMVVFCRQLAQGLNQPDAWAAIACLGPCCFFICLMSAYRGFFQGQSNMIPTSVSQVLEAITKLIVGIGLAVLVLRATDSLSLAAGGAILGVTTSCLVSTIYLHRVFRKAYRALPNTADAPDSAGSTAKQLLAIAVPITIGSAGLQILTVLETRIYMGQLLNTLTQAQADTQKGIYNMTQTIFNLPCAFITPITISVLPSIAALLAAGKHSEVKATEESAARVTGLIAAPCAVGLAVLAGPVTALLGGYTGDSLTLSTQLMTVLGLCVIFNALVLLTNAIMQAHGHVNLPVINMFIGGVVKLVIVYILTGNPNIGIVGTPIGTLLCYLCITVLNLVSMRRVLPDAPAIVKNVGKAVLSALLMGVAVFGVLQLLQYAGITSRVLLCAVPIVVGVVVYVLAVVKLKAITRADAMLLPKGEKIANLLHL
ncbi:MAG: polysaccharide biosynthesis protein [Firmicutes bacterium]|nr:polysaccharide biosynthesis protein [Bacillota bacterium]